MQTLIIGRLLVIFFLLVASWVWSSGRLRLSFETFSARSLSRLSHLSRVDDRLLFPSAACENYVLQLQTPVLPRCPPDYCARVEDGRPFVAVHTLYIVTVAVELLYEAAFTIITSLMSVLLFSYIDGLSDCRIDSVGHRPGSLSTRSYRS